MDFLTSRNGIADYTASGLGWTLHDSSFAVDADTPTVNDWVVLSSPGESGDDALYLYLTYQTVANGIYRVQSGLHWNAATNAFVSPYPATVQNLGLISGVAFSLYVYGDMDSVVILVSNGTYLYGNYYGALDGTSGDATIARTTAAVSAGSSVALPLDAVPASWLVGGKVVVRDLTNIAQATIADITGDVVTVSSLAAGYASGARVQEECCHFISKSIMFVNDGYGLIGRTGVVAGNNNTLSGYNHNANVLAAVDPDEQGLAWAVDFSHVVKSTSPAGYFGRHRNLMVVSATGITAGGVYTDGAGQSWRALPVYFSSSARMLLFREV